LFYENNTNFNDVVKRLFVCINWLSYQWTPTGAVNASVSGAQMLNRLYVQDNILTNLTWRMFATFTRFLYITFITAFRHLQH